MGGFWGLREWGWVEGRAEERWGENEDLKRGR